jgi:hypothetical protein
MLFEFSVLRLFRQPGLLSTSVGAVCLAAAVACGGTAPGTDGTGGANVGSGGHATGGAPATGGAAPGSGGASNGSGGAASGGSEGTSNSIGRVQIYRQLSINTSPGRMTATFDYVEQDAWDALSEAADCTRQEYGDCAVTTCSPSSEPTPPEPPSSTRLHAGTIQIVPDRDDFTGTGTPDGENNEYTFATTGTLLGQEIMTLTATGGMISAFQATIQVPLAPLLTSPVVTGDTGVPYEILVPRDADFTFSWDARGTGEILSTLVSDAGSSSISCGWDASDGTATIPAPALQQLDAGTEIRLMSVQTETISTPEGDISLFAGMEIDSVDRTVRPYFVLE